VKIPQCFMCSDPMFSDPTNDHPQVIARLGVSTAILNRDWQFFEGSTLLVFQDHLTELHHAIPKLQHQFIDDAARVAAALTKTFPDIKLNHGLFGNAEPHLHWHMIVRRETDPTPRTTIWESDFPIMTKSEEDFRSLAAKIRLNLPPN